MSALAPTLQAFFTVRLTSQYGVSPHTVASYRDTFRLLLAYAHEAAGTRPSDLDVGQLDANLITGFLDYLEHGRGNTIRTRNARLAAVHSFATYASYKHPEHATVLSQVLAIPRKRQHQPEITFLTNNEVDALLAAPDPDTWIGRRDRALLLVAITTGLRVAELSALTGADIHLGTGAHITCHGKGRKDRTTPLTAGAIQLLRAIGADQTAPDSFVFSTLTGHWLSRDAIAARISLHVTSASRGCPTLGTKNVTPHVLRHTAAMRLLEAGIDVAMIAIWLGHAGIESSQPYLHANMKMKEEALNRTTPTNVAVGRYQATDELLAFLNGL
ncbi:tyrosine-type recombinase/integrase [Pseudarthrobacter sp. Y6]|uniref:tyrosine-type recombinase/integrase n=1 Tax=Pseudarthrobacter sp. Y6 TaxID=3418422 RepID=UPI003CF9879E